MLACQRQRTRNFQLWPTLSPRNQRQAHSTQHCVTMIRAISRSSAFRLPVARSSVRSSVRYFSDDSHDDFKPKKTKVGSDMKEVMELIDKQVKAHPVLLFMKGTPSSPQCGFSLQAVRILNAVGADFSSINVLEYPAIREGVKKYSEWPTIPQLYITGEFIGGCDILTTMYKEGELEKLLKEKKLIGEQ